MNDIEIALVLYDGNNEMPCCDIVYKALKDMQRRLKGCDYCNLLKPLGYDGINDGIHIVHCADLWGIESDTWEFEIEYCPMCGRRLGK